MFACIPDAVAGPEAYRALVRERGWSPQRYEEWLFRTAYHELIGNKRSEKP